MSFNTKENIRPNSTLNDIGSGAWIRLKASLDLPDTSEWEKIGNEV